MKYFTQFCVKSCVVSWTTTGYNRTIKEVSGHSCVKREAGSRPARSSPPYEGVGFGYHYICLETMWEGEIRR